MKRGNRIKTSGVNRRLNILAGSLTVFWICLLCFPIYWMVITSLSGSYSEYASGISFLPDIPQRYTVTMDYTEAQRDRLGTDGVYLEANSLLWRMYNYKMAGTGKAEVIVTVEGEGAVSYTLSKANYEINKEKMWSKSILKHADIERVIPVIEENGWVAVKENAQLPKTQKTNQYSEQIFAELVGDADITGTITGCSYCPSYDSIFDNYKIAWAYPSKLGIAGGIARPIMNTLFVAVLTISLNVFVASLAAYSISKLLPRSIKYKLQLFIMASGMVPATLTLIPKFQVVQNIGLANSLWALILPGCASFGAMLLFKGTFDAYPNEIIEASRIDGAGELYIFLRVALPAAKGVVGVQILSIFASTWNTYFWPSMIIRDESKYTVALILNYMMNIGSNTYPVLLALGFIISIPTLFVYAFFQKYLTYGIDFSGVKG